MVQRYIEYDLPLKEISHYSAIEKNIRHGHPSSLLLWWARRPLAASRATNFASLINKKDFNVNNEVEKIIKRMLPWEAVKEPNGKYILEAKKYLKKEWNLPPKILDPFGGGGSIPLEALRLGCETYSIDYNPVAVLIQKATLEWPQKYLHNISVNDSKQLKLDGSFKEKSLLHYLIEKWSKEILNDIKQLLGGLYPDYEGNIPVCYLWARTIPCQNPKCNKEIPLIKQFWLAKYDSNNSNKNVAFKVIVENNELKYKIYEGSEIDFDPSEGTVTRGNAKCPFCGQVTKRETNRKMAFKGYMSEKMIIVIYHREGKSGKKYVLASDEDYNVYKLATLKLKQQLETWSYLENPLPDEKLHPNPRYMTPYYYGMTTWSDIYNDRQKLMLVSMIKLIKEKKDEIKNDCQNICEKLGKFDYTLLANVIMSYLSIMLCRLMDFNSTLCLLNPTGGRGVVHVFGRNALSMTWDYVESNPFNPKGASWISTIERTLMVLEHLSFSSEVKSEVKLASATSLPFSNNYFDAIFTDPPYYDNVPYADLSDYFYVILKRCIGDIFPDLFTTPLTPKKLEIVADNVRHENSKEHFEKMLSIAFKEIYRVLKNNGIATIIYAYKTTEGWETMLNSLINSKLVVTASWPIHTERAGRLRAASSAALASSIYMVCRKIDREKIGFWNDIKNEIKIRVVQKLNQFWNQGIIGGDFFISAIGPGMEIFSKYESVENYSGEKISTYDLLEYIRSICSNYIINQLLKNGTSYNIDYESQFYLAYRWTFMDNRVEYDDARKLASSMGVYLEDLTGKTGFINKKGKYIEVLNPKKRYEIKTPKTLIDVVHKCLILWDEGKSDEIKEILKNTDYDMSDVFWRYCQAISESLLPGNKEKQLLEGFLVGRNRYSDFSLSREKRNKLDFYLEEKE